MKYFSFIILLSLLACKPTEITIQKPAKTYQKSLENNFKIVEKTALIPHQKLKVVKDEWGKKYIKLLPGKHTILKYVYAKKLMDKNLMDAGSNQIIWFTLANNRIKNETYKTADLQKNPLYVQITGFRNSRFIPVKNATISIKIIKNNTVDISIQIAPEYTHILKKNIHQILTLNQ